MTGLHWAGLDWIGLDGGVCTYMYMYIYIYIHIYVTHTHVPFVYNRYAISLIQHGDTPMTDSHHPTHPMPEPPLWAAEDGIIWIPDVASLEPFNETRLGNSQIGHELFPCEPAQGIKRSQQNEQCHRQATLCQRRQKKR